MLDQKKPSQQGDTIMTQNVLSFKYEIEKKAQGLAR